MRGFIRGGRGVRQVNRREINEGRSGVGCSPERLVRGKCRGDSIGRRLRDPLDNYHGHRRSSILKLQPSLLKRNEHPGILLCPVGWEIPFKGDIEVSRQARFVDHETIQPTAKTFDKGRNRLATDIQFGGHIPPEAVGEEGLLDFRASPSKLGLEAAAIDSGRPNAIARFAILSGVDEREHGHLARLVPQSKLKTIREETTHHIGERLTKVSRCGPRG